MKLFNYISLLGAALAFAACESDLETVTYNAADAQAAVLAELDAAYVLDAQLSDQTALTLQWTEPELGYPAVATNYIQLDVAGNQFANHAVAASVGKGGSYAITHNDLNNLLMGILEDRGMELAAADFEFRIATTISPAADTLYSNVVSTRITPFVGERQYPQLWVIGDYCGWNHGSCQYLYSANEDDNYAAMIYFDGKAANGWKLTPAAEATSQILVTSGGANINVYSHNSYYLEFNTTTGELKASQAYDSWGIVGAHNNWGSGDTPMTLASETDATGATQYYLTATMDMAAGNTWKIRPDEKWENDKGPAAVELEGDAADNGDGNFRVDAAGNYTIKWYFNKVTQRLVVTKN